jgi:hypothetical protein
MSFKTEFFLYLFAGLPLKHVAATGIAHPGTNGEICFCVIALYWEGGIKHSPACLSSTLFATQPRIFGAPPRRSRLFVMMRDMVRDDSPPGHEQRLQTRVSGRAPLPHHSHRSRSQDQEEKENGPRQDHPENDLPQADPPSRTGFGVRQRRRRGRGHCCEIVIGLRTDRNYYSDRSATGNPDGISVWNVHCRRSPAMVDWAGRLGV